MLNRLVVFIALLLAVVAVEGRELQEMTLEEKVGQLFMVYFEGEEANGQAERLIRDMKIGGVVYYTWANGLRNPQQVQKMSCGLQELANRHIGIPLFISADQEGGAIMRLDRGFTEFPGNAALERTGQPELAYEAAYYMGKEMKAVGVNFNLAPVVDVNNNRANPIIGVRSFSGDPEIVAIFGKESLRGFKDAGVIPCLKHFPGHGDVTVDSHLARPVVNKSYQEIEKLELVPFKRLVADAPVIMTAHILFPQIDPKNCATLSSTILQEILREKLGFKGVLMTDSLTMSGVLDGYANAVEIALKAIEAGNDILLIGGRDLLSRIAGETNVEELARLHRGVVDAVRKGKISEKRIDASVARILKLKKDAGLFDRPSLTNEEIRKKEHLKLANEIAYRSVEIQNWNLKRDLSQLNIAIIAPKGIEEKIKNTDLMQVGAVVTLHTFTDFEPSAAEQRKILDSLDAVQYVIFCSYNAWKQPKQLELLKKVVASKPTACIAMRDPNDLDSARSAEITIAAYSPNTCSLQVAADYLCGTTHPLAISLAQAQEVGKKIWRNECSNRVDQLTFWSEKEPFPSLGIGHFIWPPEEYKGTFSHGRFHAVVEFLQKRDVKVPRWLATATFSPWVSREEFYREFDSAKMKELRLFLQETIPDQTEYMVERLNHAFGEIVLSTPPKERQDVINQFFRVGRTFYGPYILVDYLNFKHEGTDPKERYQGKGWGLSQVLQTMASGDFMPKPPPEERFAMSAKKLLQERVVNAPDPQKEGKWLPGWLNRLDTYYIP